MEGLWPSNNDEFRVMLWGQEAGKLSIKAPQGWSAVLLQHTGLLYVARAGSGVVAVLHRTSWFSSCSSCGVSCSSSGMGSVSGMGWISGMGWMSGICHWNQPALHSTQAFWQVQPLCISGPWLFLQAFLWLHMTTRAPCKSWPKSAIFPDQMNFKQKQYSAQLMVLESNTEGDNKFPL